MLKEYKQYLKTEYTYVLKGILDKLKQKNCTVADVLTIVSVSGTSPEIRLLDKLIFTAWEDNYSELFEVIKNNKNLMKDYYPSYIYLALNCNEKATRQHYFSLETKEKSEQYELTYSAIVRIIDFCFLIWFPDGALPLALDSNFKPITLKNTSYLTGKTNMPFMLPAYNISKLNKQELDLLSRISKSAHESKYYYMLTSVDDNIPVLNISLDVLKYFNKLYLAKGGFTAQDEKNINAFKGNSMILAEDLFYTRKYIVPQSGVVLDILNHPVFDRILVKELEMNNELYFIKCDMRFNDGTEFPYIINIKGMKAESWIAPIVMELMKILVKFYQVNTDEVEIEPTEYDFDIVTPDYWKYKGKQNKSKHSENSIHKETVGLKQLYTIKPFIRKLNKGAKASDEALALAKRLHIKVEDGYTIVNEHERLYNIKI